MMLAHALSGILDHLARALDNNAVQALASLVLTWWAGA